MDAQVLWGLAVVFFGLPLAFLAVALMVAGIWWVLHRVERWMDTWMDVEP